MSEQELVRLFAKYGYATVCTFSRYSALRPEDIKDRQVIRGACPVVEVSYIGLEEWDISKFEQSLQWHLSIQHFNNNPFNTRQTYEILPRKEV